MGRDLLPLFEDLPAGIYRVLLAKSIPARPHLEMGFRSKLLTPETLPEWRRQLRQAGKKLAVTNGCFDLLHLGHVTYLEQARAQADVLLVGINGDEGVRALKGEGRPINAELDRALVVAALESVAAVFIFPEERAVTFLQAVQPDVYVKGGDYTLESLHPEEREVVESCGAQIALIPFVQGKSTTSLLDRLGGDQPPKP